MTHCDDFEAGEYRDMAVSKIFFSQNSVAKSFAHGALKGRSWAFGGVWLWIARLVDVLSLLYAVIPFGKTN